MFLADGDTHREMIRACFDAPVATYTYTSAEVVSTLQAGVRVRAGAFGATAEGELVRKVTFGTPEHHTLERLAMRPTDACRALVQRATPDELARMYAVQEVLTAQISEQTCGRLDAEGRFVGLGRAEAELQAACVQESLEPVAVGYRTVPLQDLLPDVRTVDVGAEGCRFGPIVSAAAPSKTTLAINGVVMDVRGAEARASVVNDLMTCGERVAAEEFEAWRRARRTTNAACATLLGCYPFSVGIVAGVVAKKHRDRMLDALNDAP